MNAEDTMNIATCMPHQGDMCWLQNLQFCDSERIVADTVISADHPFADALGVPAWTGIEYMAQAIAAWAGQRALQRGESIKPGFLLGTRRYDSLRSHFALGLRLRVEAQCELFGDNGLGMFSCRLFDADCEIARANLSVYEPPLINTFLQESSTT